MQIGMIGIIFYGYHRILGLTAANEKNLAIET